MAYYFSADGIISIHALLTESDYWIKSSIAAVFAISIHALLTESDAAGNKAGAESFKFLSTLSLRRATNVACGDRHKLRDFYPRSPYGERRNTG